MFGQYGGFTCLVLLTAFCFGVDGLFCFKCLNIDCSGDDLECQRSRAFIVSELKHLYYIGSYLDPCPQLNETYNWRLMQISDEPCRAEKAGEATCTLGSMQIRTTESTPDGVVKTRVNHATVMGCAKRSLLRRINEAFDKSGRCDLISVNQTSVGVIRQLHIEHCRDLTKMCYEKDYCIDWTKSEIKLWEDHAGAKKFDYTLKVGIFAVVVVVIFALLIAGMFKEPAGRPNNFPTTIGDASETVKVLEINDKKDTLTSIEVEQHSIRNGTMSKRPSIAPPPPPRRSVNRESTPV